MPVLLDAAASTLVLSDTESVVIAFPDEIRSLWLAAKTQV